MDKEHGRILISILTMVLIFAVQVIFEHVKKRREEAKGRQIRRPAPRQSGTDTSDRRWPSIFDDELTETVEKPDPKPASNFTPVEAPPSETDVNNDEIVQSLEANEDIRRAVIWSEILNRKYC